MKHRKDLSEEAEMPKPKKSTSWLKTTSGYVRIKHNPNPQKQNKIPLSYFTGM